ncbi:MAG: biopolymer transporter ExbD [Bacteroidetes bacterium]|nr:biopolymer transporter ExbD [Bacteroidota bacterium]
MAIKSRQRISAEFSTASMSDLVFLLLIFFMLTSTLISPSAIKLLLPASKSRAVEEPPKFTISINDQHQYFLDGVQVDEPTLDVSLMQLLQGKVDASIRLEADKVISIQEVVTVIDIVNQINQQNQTRHRVILATQPQKQ